MLLRALWANDARGAAMVPAKSAVKVRRSTMVSSVAFLIDDTGSVDPAIDRRPGADGIEQRPVALLDDVAFGERGARFLAERVHHPVVAIIAKQHYADQGRKRRATGFAKSLGHLGASRGAKVG